MKTIIHNNQTFVEISKGKGYYYICKETTEILSLMRPNYPLILKPSINGNGYYMVGFFSKKERININIHRAMMETFVPNPSSYPHINHIDGNKLNNNLMNLEWCSSSYNTQHVHTIGLATSEHCEIEVHQYYLDGSYKASFKSLHEAARQTDGHASNIKHCIDGKIKTAVNSLWSYTKLPSIEPYLGTPIVNYYLLNGTKVNSLKELCEKTTLTRALIHRRFKKHGNSFQENEFVITRILCQ